MSEAAGLAGAICPANSQPTPGAALADLLLCRPAAIVTRDSPYPLGATVSPDGVHFSVFSKAATRIDLLLFDSYAAVEPSAVIAFDPIEHRTYHYWHRFVPNLRAGQVYAYRAHGPFDP